MLCLTTLSGVLFTDHFPQTVHAESVGFDALAHDLFDRYAHSHIDGKARAAEVAAG